LILERFIEYGVTFDAADPRTAGPTINSFGRMDCYRRGLVSRRNFLASGQLVVQPKSFAID